MLRKLMESMRPDEIVAPPEVEADPIAKAADWGPLKHGGASFKTHRLVQESPQRWLFKATVGAKIFYALFLIIGIVVAIGFVIGLWQDADQEWTATLLIPILGGGVFAGLGGWMLMAGTRPIVFDKTIGWHWKGHRKPTDVFDTNDLKQAVKLEEIHALQLIREYVRGGRNSSGYYSYELNVILKDSSRLNVVDHGKLKDLLDDGQALAEFLGCPLYRSV